MICNACSIKLTVGSYYTYTLSNGTELNYCMACVTLQKLGIIDSVGNLLIILRSESGS